MHIGDYVTYVEGHVVVTGRVRDMKTRVLPTGGVLQTEVVTDVLLELSGTKTWFGAEVARRLRPATTKEAHNFRMSKSKNGFRW